MGRWTTAWGGGPLYGEVDPRMGRWTTASGGIPNQSFLKLFHRNVIISFFGAGNTGTSWTNIEFRLKSVFLFLLPISEPLEKYKLRQRQTEA